jgi:hypothetical protein
MERPQWDLAGHQRACGDCCSEPSKSVAKVTRLLQFNV